MTSLEPKETVITSTNPIPAPGDAKVVYERAIKLGTGVVMPFFRTTRRMMLGFAGAAVIALIAGVATGRPIVALIVGIAASVVAAAIAWWDFFDEDYRQAAELFYDHDCHERAEWKAETGTPIPKGRPAINHWLLAHPTGPGRASLLLAVGRLDEADQAIESMTPATPEEAFGVEILRRTRILFAGGTPELGDLHASWRELPDPRERRHRRECLAVMDAYLAVDAGADPIEPMARGRREIGEVHRTMRVPWLLAKWSSFAVLGVGTATLIAAIVTGAV